MANIKTFFKSGHPPTLFASFLYFDFCFAVWVLNGAMAPFITKEYHLTQDQTTLMVTLPTMAGALMRFPLGVMSQYIGRKNAALVEMSCIMIAMAFGYFYVNSYNGGPGDGRAPGYRRSQLRGGVGTRLGLVPAGVQRAGNGHRRGPATAARPSPRSSRRNSPRLSDGTPSTALRGCSCCCPS